MIQLDNVYFKKLGLAFKPGQAAEDGPDAKVKTFPAEAVEISLALNKKQIPLKARHLGNGVFKVKISVDESLFSSREKLSGAWRIILEDETFEVLTTAIVQ